MVLLDTTDSNRIERSYQRKALPPLGFLPLSHRPLTEKTSRQIIRRAADLSSLVFAAVLTAASFASIRAATPSWLTGNRLDQQLRQPVPVLHWRGAPLRQALETLALANRIPLLIDRRIDPGQSLTLSPENVPLIDAFRLVAEHCDLSIGRIGPVVYFGPREFGRRLEATVELRRDDVLQLSSAARRPWLKASPISWGDLTEPRQLLAGLAGEAGVEIDGLPQVPHDLWAAADLPPLSLVDRFGLIIGQYDLTLKISDDGRSAQLVPIPYAVAAGRESVVRRSRDRRPHPETAPKAPSQQTRYTIREAKGKLSRLLDELADRLQLQLRSDDAALQAAGISLDQQVLLSVSDATLEELFESLLRPAGCTFSLEGKTLTVRPAKSTD